MIVTRKTRPFLRHHPVDSWYFVVSWTGSIFLVRSDPGSNGNLLLIYILPGAKLSARPIWFNCFLNFGIQNSFYIHHQNFNGSVLMQNISRQLGSQNKIKYILWRLRVRENFLPCHSKRPPTLTWPSSWRSVKDCFVNLFVPVLQQK